MLKTVLLVILAIQYACPGVAPMPDFDIEKFLGVWYQVQPNLDSDVQFEQDIPSCEFYNISYSEEPNKYVVSTMFEQYTQFDGITPLKYASISTNYLTSLDENLPAKMTITPDVAHIIESNFTLYATEYESYAIISNCDKEISEGETNFRQHATLWSRTRDVGDSFVEKLYDSIGSFDFDPYDLSDVSTTGCIEGGRKIVTVDLDNDKIIPN